MPFNGGGSYSPPGADFPAVAGTLIESTKFNNVINDIATALSNVIARDGQSAISANLPMTNFRHTGVGNAVARTDYSAYGQVQDSSAVWTGVVGGTANALTGNLTPAITAYVAGQAFRWKALSTNTGAATIAFNGLAAKALQQSGLALPGGAIVQDGIYEGVYDGTAFQVTALSVPAWTTGDTKLSYKVVADPGWILLDDGTIGSAASAATTRANADTEALYTLLWNNTTDANCAVSTGRGANAAADFAANKTIALPKVKGRELAIYGAGAGLTARTLAQAIGAETIVIAAANLPASGLSVPSLSIPVLGVVGSVSSTIHITDATGTPGATRLSGNLSTNTNGASNADDTDHAVTGTLSGAQTGGVSGTGTGTTGNMGTGTAKDVITPRSHICAMVKL